MSATPQDYNFIRALIKMENPTWTIEQIEEELKKNTGLMVNINLNNPYEACSE